MTNLGTQFLQNAAQNAQYGAQGTYVSQNYPQTGTGIQPKAQASMQKSDLLQKYLAKTNSANSANQGNTYATAQGGIQNMPWNIQQGLQNTATKTTSANQAYIPSSTMQIPSVLEGGPGTDTFEDPKKIKKAKIAAFSLAGLVLGTLIAILGATKSGRNASKALSNFVTTNLKTFFADFSKKHDSEWADKIYKNIHKLSVESGNASGGLENITNGKDVLCRNIAENLSGVTADGKVLPESSNKIVQFVRNTFGKVFGLYHKLDNKTTGFYKGRVEGSTIKRYSGALESFDDVQKLISKALSDLQNSPNANKIVVINGKEMKACDIIPEVEKMLQNIKENLDNSFSADKIKERLVALNAFMTDDGTGRSLSQKTTEGFVENIKGKRIKSLFARPVAGNILKDKKAEHTGLIGGFRRQITNNLNSVIGQDKEIVAELRRYVNPDDVESVRKLDDIIKTLGKLKKANLDTTTASKEAVNTIFSKLDDLQQSVSTFSSNGKADDVAGNSVEKIIRTIENVKGSIQNIQTGEAEDVMSILRQILEPETYVDVVKPGMKRFRGELNRACALEMNDTFDKLRDVNCGSAPTDIGGIILSTALLGLYTAQADDADERVGVALTTGIPILSTMGTCLFAAVNQISGKKALLLGGAVAFTTKTICDGLNRLYRKHKGLDENAKPSIVTIDDYINDYINPYVNKFEQVFFEPVNSNTQQGVQQMAQNNMQ